MFNIIKNPYRFDVLVNKNNKLKDNYYPNDLKYVNSDYTIGMQFLRRNVVYYFEKMCKQAKLDGFNIKAVSTFRSSDYQEKLYNNYCVEKGIDYAFMVSAKKGYSEHQTGLAVDVADISGDYDNFINSNEFKWMEKNSYKYGFILRYPKYKTDITGYKFEPWHFRYVGLKLARYIYENNLTLDEYKKKSLN